MPELSVFIPSYNRKADMNLTIDFLEPQRPKFNWLWVLLILITLLTVYRLGWAEVDYSTYTNEQIANAIYYAEGGKHTKHPYGILAHYKHTTPKQACINTINHVIKDWNGKGDFISFLGGRYCPVGCSNDNGTNQYWISNVKRLLVKEAGSE